MLAIKPNDTTVFLLHFFTFESGFKPFKKYVWKITHKICAKNAPNCAIMPKIEQKRQTFWKKVWKTLFPSLLVCYVFWVTVPPWPLYSAALSPLWHCIQRLYAPLTVVFWGTESPLTLYSETLCPSDRCILRHWALSVFRVGLPPCCCILNNCASMAVVFWATDSHLALNSESLFPLAAVFWGTVPSLAAVF